MRRAGSLINGEVLFWLCSSCEQEGWGTQINGASSTSWELQVGVCMNVAILLRSASRKYDRVISKRNIFTLPPLVDLVSCKSRE